MAAVLGKQGRVLGVAAGIGERRRRRGGPFIVGLGRWRGGGRWPAPRVLRRPLMVPDRPLRVTVRRGRRGRGTGQARCAVVVARRVWWRPTRWRDAGGGVRRARLSGRRGDAARRRDASSAQRAAAGDAAVHMGKLLCCTVVLARAARAGLLRPS